MSNLLCLRFRDSHISASVPLAWTLLSPTGQIEASGHTLLRDLPEVLPEENGAANRCIVIVGSEAALLSTVEVPAKQQRHLKQIVPFLVEEQIVDPIEAMHLAMPVLHKGEQVSVAAIRRDRLQDWLDELLEVNIAPDYLFLDTLCVPRRQGHWQLLFDDARLLFRDGDCSGMVLTPDTASTVLQLALSRESTIDGSKLQESAADPEFGDEDSSDIVNRAAQRAERDARAAASAARVILIDSENQASEREAFAALGDGVPATDARGGSEDRAQDPAIPHDPHEATLLGEDYVNPGDLAGTASASSAATATDAGGAIGNNTAAPDNWLAQVDGLVRSENIATAHVRYSETVSELLAVSAVQSLDTTLNLLQGDFRPATANAAQRRFLRKISGAVAACLAAFLLLTLGGGFYLNLRADSYFDQSVAIYRDLFPKQRKVIDPVRQMKRQLRGNSVGATTSDFLPLLDAASRSLQSLEAGEGEEPSIKQLRYDTQRGHIAIDLHAGNIDQLEAYRDLLTAEGLQVDILSANQDGDTIKGRIQVGRS